jgi:hypothetical protein
MIKRHSAPFAFILLLAVVMAALFVPYATRYFFIFDDYAQLDLVSRFSFWEILQNPQHGNYRPTAFLFWKSWLMTFGIDHPFAFSLANLATHSINASLLGFVLLRFNSQVFVAWSAAAVFLVFPSINEAIFWVSGGHDVYGMTFVLLGMLVASMGLYPRSNHALGAMTLLLFSATLVAMLSKENYFVAFPLLLSLALLHNKNQPRPSLNTWFLWFVATNAAVLVFFLIRGAVIPLSVSSYGDPREFYVSADLFANFINNVKALFTFGHVDAGVWTSFAYRAASALSVAVIFIGLFRERHRPGIWALFATLGLALGVTAFTQVEPGSASGGRLFYVPAAISSILIAEGLNSFRSCPRLIRRTSVLALYCAKVAYGVLALLISLQVLSLSFFAARFSDSAAIARNIMTQLRPLSGHDFVYIPNLPHNLSHGPYTLKCYAPAMYLILTEGQSPKFRCDSVVIDQDAEGWRQVHMRGPDPFSQYQHSKTNEMVLTVSLSSGRE